MFYLNYRKGNIVVRFLNPTKKIKTLTINSLKSRCNFNIRNPALATITHMHLTIAVLMKAMDCGVVKNNGQYLESLMQTLT
jgi:hypothetical protein